MGKKLSMATAVGILMSANLVMAAPVFAHGHVVQGSGSGRGTTTTSTTTKGQSTTARSSHGKSATKSAKSHSVKQHTGHGAQPGKASTSGHAAKGLHANDGQAGPQVQGVVQKVYGAIAKLDAYQAITLRAHRSIPITSQGRKVKTHAKQVATHDLQSAHHFLSSAVKQLGVAEKVYGVAGSVYGPNDSTDSSSTTVTAATYGTGMDVKATLKQVATALQADEAAVSALIGSDNGDVNSIVDDLRSQIVTLRSLKSSLPNGTAPIATGRK